jgi:peptidoglycan/xylan/chitin deacetylase (PgdA/CDA1 family)
MTGTNLLITAANAARRRFVRSIKLHTSDGHTLGPVVSFTFDDFPRSALTEGGRMLREAGWTGTYYVAGGFCGRIVDGIDYFSRNDLLQVDHDGHEIGCHTFSHISLRSLTVPEILDDLHANAAFIREILPGHAFSSFAYPFGDLSLHNKVLLASQFDICRGVSGGLNVGRIDFAELRSVLLRARSFEELKIESWLERAVASKAWLIFVTHDISDNPSPYGCPTSVFAKIIESISKRGIKVLSVKDAAELARSANAEEDFL